MFIDPMTHVLHDAVTVLHDVKHLDAAQWSKILEDVAGVLGIVALLPIPGVDVVAGLLALGVGATATGLEFYAAHKGEAGASYLDAGLATVVTLALTFGCRHGGQSGSNSGQSGPVAGQGCRRR